VMVQDNDEQRNISGSAQQARGSVFIA